MIVGAILVTPSTRDRLSAPCCGNGFDPGRQFGWVFRVVEPVSFRFLWALPLPSSCSQPCRWSWCRTLWEGGHRPPLSSVHLDMTALGPARARVWVSIYCSNDARSCVSWRPACPFVPRLRMGPTGHGADYCESRLGGGVTCVIRLQIGNRVDIVT